VAKKHDLKLLATLRAKPEQHELEDTPKRPVEDRQDHHRPPPGSHPTQATATEGLATGPPTRREAISRAAEFSAPTGIPSVSWGFRWVWDGARVLTSQTPEANRRGLQRSYAPSATLSSDRSKSAAQPTNTPAQPDRPNKRTPHAGSRVRSGFLDPSRASSANRETDVSERLDCASRQGSETRYVAARVVLI
jgi:hypothetical protein